MATEVILPRVDMDMEAGKITQWFAAEGDTIVKGKPLFEIETDKAAMEVEAPADGILRGLHAPLGEMLPVGAVVGWICAPGETFEAPTSLAAGAPSPLAGEGRGGGAPAIAATDVTAAPPRPAVVPGDLRATPAARRLARARGVDLAALEGSGPRGRVQARDVGEGYAAGRLHGEWLARGSGAPLVFIHGFGADLNGWRPLSGHLAPGRGQFALDLPGHGRSALDDVSLAAFVAAVAATLAAEGIGGAHLVGHSLGGAVAAAFAAAHPGRVRSLTLLAPAGLGPEFNGAFANGFLAAQGEASLAAWLRELVVDEAALGSAMVKATLARRAEQPLVDTQGRVAAALFPDGTQAVSIRPALAAYTGPARVVFGREDRIVPPRQARGLPGAVALHLLANVGHMPHFEARAPVAAIVEDNVAAGERREA